MRVRDLEERERKESKKLADEDALRKIRVAEETIEHLQKKLAATKQVAFPQPPVFIYFFVFCEALNRSLTHTHYAPLHSHKWAVLHVFEMWQHHANQNMQTWSRGGTLLLTRGRRPLPMSLNTSAVCNHKKHPKNPTKITKGIFSTHSFSRIGHSSR